MKLQRKITILQKKLDRQIQQNRKPALCECCGDPAQVFHHYVQKSQSAYLRYRKENLINLCSACHFAHHTKSEPNVVARIIDHRGKKWEQWIQDHRSILIKRDKEYLECLLQLEERLTT